MENILYERVSLPLEAEYTVNRPQIIEHLEKALSKPLTTVIAGAGYGKTHAVSMLLKSTTRNAIWFQLSELDNAITRFWERIVYGLRPYSQDLANSLKKLGYPETMSAFNKFLHLFASVLEKSDPFVIIFDDFYTIHNQNIISFIENIIIARIKNLSIVLVSRTKPNLNLTSMFIKGLATFITEDELRFTYEETQKYCEQQGLSLSDEDIRVIYGQTEGWVLATYLVGLSIKKGTTYIRNPISLIDIFTLIEREIFAVLSVSLQQLLLKLATLEGVPKELLFELAGQNEDIIVEMSRKSLLMRYEVFSDRYHIHNLFRIFLLERKNKLAPDQIADLHKTAGQWHESNGNKVEAVSHYIKCNDYDKVFSVILSMDRRLPQSTMETVIQIIEQAPVAALQAMPIMHVVKALYLFINNRIVQAYDVLTHLRVHYEDMSDGNENGAILGEIYMLLGLIGIVRQDDEFEQLFMKADMYLPNGSALVDHRLNIAEGINITGIKHPVPGELEKKYNVMMRANRYMTRVMNGCCCGADYLNAADSCYMTGDIRNAEKNAYEAISRARQRQQYGVECMANFILARIHMMKGEYAKIDSLLKQMEEQLNTLQIADSLVLYDIIKGWVYTKLGEIDKIPKWILQEEETRKRLSPVIVGREYLVRSDALLAEGRYYELLAFMSQTDTLYEQRGILYAMIQNKITRAIVHHYIGDHEDSIRALNEAYALSNPNNLVILYIEYGHQMRTTINAAKRSDLCTIPLEWLDSIYTKSSAYAKQISHVGLTYKTMHVQRKQSKILLSKREREVLTCLSNGMTRSEIANNFDLSVNTVKSILQSVYSKLGAINSVNAVQIAIAEELVERTAQKK